MPTMTEKPAGSYKVALYSNDKMLAQEGFRVSQDLNARASAAAAEKAVAAAAAAEVKSATTRCGASR